MIQWQEFTNAVKPDLKVVTNIFYTEQLNGLTELGEANVHIIS